VDERKLLTHELQYYCIDWIKLTPPPPPPPKLVFTAGDSAILTAPTDRETMCRILDTVSKEPKLTLLHTMAQGAAAAHFDPKVAGKGRILVVVQSSAGHIFGGFTFDVLGTGYGWLNHSEANPGNFVFALGNKTGTPLKLLPAPGNNSVHTAGCGFHLGADLVAFCSSHYCNSSSFTVAAPGFATVTLQPGTLCGNNPGTHAYTPLNMEVFQVQ
jgi:hypothetical protein